MKYFFILIRLFIFRRTLEKEIQNSHVLFVEFLLLCFNRHQKDQCVEHVIHILGIKLNITLNRHYYLVMAYNFYNCNHYSNSIYKVVFFFFF